MMNREQGTMGSVLGNGRRALSEEVPVGYKRTEVGVIPEEWECGRLGDLTTRVGSGITPSGGARVYVMEGRPFLRSQNVGSGALDLADLAFITDEIHASFAASEIEEGDVLLNITGASIGRSAVADITVARGNVNQHVCEIRTDPKRLDSHFLNSYLLSAAGQKQIDSFQAGGNRQGLNYSQIRSFLIPRPTLSEQRTIAEALSDVDGLLAAFEALIAKKRAIKQATMQQLLTGKTRLPGFSGEWETKRLGSVLTVRHGRSQRYITGPDGKYPILASGGEIGRTDVSLYDKPSVLIGRKGTIDDPQYVSSPFWTVDTLFYTEIVDGMSAKFLYYKFCMIPWRNYNEASGVPSLNSRTIESIEVNLPKSDEQHAIAAVLSDMDAEIAALERRRDKTRAIKQGMMQQLLTGRIRLVKLEEVTEQTAVTVSVARKHNWQFNEAVVISALIRKFCSKQYPLGRMRYTKLSYLLHRRQEGYAEGYLKKAAGPYNPRTRYGGPEKIALQNDYVRQYRSGKRQGFVAGTNVDEAERYFDKWYGSEALQWLEKFRYKTNDDLELLTTVDMAAEELRGAGKKVSVESVRKVIHRHPEWNPKLDRPIFTDANLARAIEICRTLFAVGGDEVAP